MELRTGDTSLFQFDRFIIFHAETRLSLQLSLNRIEINFATATCLPARPQETRGEKGDKKGKEKGKKGE